ncbi:hypothetical protein [Massilia cavernae]|uniref:hypothetical protein n=1 Tax=Massilia cavernae TaxID=2320864 RepID=UPI0016014334|nr:hypothetical protein [Massilia cavernae]
MRASQFGAAGGERHDEGESQQEAPDKYKVHYTLTIVGFDKKKSSQIRLKIL